MGRPAKQIWVSVAVLAAFGVVASPVQHNIAALCGIATAGLALGIWTLLKGSKDKKYLACPLATGSLIPLTFIARDYEWGTAAVAALVAAIFIGLIATVLVALFHGVSSEYPADE